MKTRVAGQLEKALPMLEASATLAKQGSFAHKLQAASLQAHVDDLGSQIIIEEMGRAYELLDIKLRIESHEATAIPLATISQAVDAIRKAFGYAALRISEGGMHRKRVPEYIYKNLDLRLAGYLPDSPRLTIAVAGHGDLTSDGIAQSLFERLFNVLVSHGRGEAFLQAVTSLGPLSAYRLAKFLHVIVTSASSVEFTWSSAGKEILRWNSDARRVNELVSALELTEFVEMEELVEGVVERLDSRELVSLRLASKKDVKVLCPKRLTDRISKLHPGQQVSFRCKVIDTINPFIPESSRSYDLVDVVQPAI